MCRFERTHEGDNRLYVFCALCMICQGSAVSCNRQDCNRQSMQQVVNQTRSQIGTLGGAKSFLIDAQIFWTMSNTFFQEGKNFFCAPSPQLHACANHLVNWDWWVFKCSDTKCSFLNSHCHDAGCKKQQKVVKHSRQYQRLAFQYCYVTVVLSYFSASNCSLNCLNLWLLFFCWFPRVKKVAYKKVPD